MVGVMTKNPTKKYGRLAEECRQKAERAARPVDQQAWLKLAEDWDELARGASEAHVSAALATDLADQPGLDIR
jgi:hypothetical protein